MIMARNRSGWSVRTSSAMELHGISPAMIGAPVTGVTLGRLLRRDPMVALPSSGAKALWGWIEPGLAKLPRRIHMKRCRYEMSVELGPCCTPRSSAIATDDARPRRWATVSSSDTAIPQRAA